MDSSYYNHSYGQWHVPFSPRSSSASAVPPPHPQSYPENPNFYGRSSNSGGHHENHHHYSHRRELPPPPPPPMVNQPPPYYSAQPPPHQHFRYNPQQLTYESPRISQPSPSSSCTESRVVPQSAWVERKDSRPDSWISVADAGPGRKYQFDYGRLSRGSSGDSISHGSDSNSRFRDELRSLAYVREEFGASRIEGNYQDCGQLRMESARSSRVLGAENKGLPASFGFGNDRYGATVDRGMSRSSASNDGSGNQRWVVDGKVSNGGRTLFPQKKDDYYHSEIERYFNNGSREGCNELNRTPKKQMQKKSVLLRIETPKPNQKGRENDRSRHPSYYNENRSNSFRGKDHLGHFDRGLVEKQRGRTPVELDVSFKSNVLVAKAIASPTTAGVSSGVSVTPRSSKVRRVLVIDTDEKASLNVGIAEVDIKKHVLDKASGSQGSKPSEMQVAASEKKSDSHSSTSSIVSKDKINAGKHLDGVLVDCKVETTDTDLEASVDAGAPKICSSVHSVKKVSSFDEALKQSKGDVDAEHDSNLKPYSPGENVFDGDKSILKSHEDVLDRKGTSCNAGEILLPKVMKETRTVKSMTKKVSTPCIFPVLQATEKISKCSEGGVPFAGLSMCSTEQPCENDVSKNCVKGVSSRDLLMKETYVGFEGRKSSSLGALGYGEKELDEPSTEAAIFSNCQNVADQLLAKSAMSNCDGIGDGSKGIHRKEDSLYSDDDFSRDCPGDIGSSAGNVKCSTSVLEVNNVTGDLANANTFSLESSTMPRVDSRERTVVFQSSSQVFENRVSPLVESVNFKGSMETRPFEKAEETGGNLGSDAGKQTCVNDISSSPKHVAGKGSLNALPVGRIDGCLPGVCKNREGLSDESDSARAISCEMRAEYVTCDNFVPNQDMDLGSYHPARDPFTDQFSVLDSSGLKACFSESDVSLRKDINGGRSEFSLEQEMRKTVPSSCGKVPGSPALLIDNNLAIGNSNESGNETISGSECCPPEVQPCSVGDMILLKNHLGCRSSDAAGSLWDCSVDNDLIKPSRVSSCLVHDSSATLCHLSLPVPVDEQIQNTASVHANCSKSQDGIIDKESARVQNLEVDNQEEKVKLSDEASNCRSPGTDIVTIGGDSVFPCDSLSCLPGLNIGQAQNETSVAGTVDKTGNMKESEKENVLLDALQEQIMTFHEAIQPGSSLEHCLCSGQTSPSTDVDSYESLVSNYPGGGSTEKRNGDPMENPPDIPSEVEALAFDGKVSESDNLDNSDAPPSRSLSHADARCVFGDAKDQLKSVPAPDSKGKALTLSSMSEETQRKESTSKYAVQKSCSRSSFVVSGKRNPNPPTCITKPNTWRRKSDTSASSLAASKPLSSTCSTQQKLPKGTLQVNSTYVRKGNSLVRKPSLGTPGGVSLGLPPSAFQANHLDVDEDNNMGSVGKADADETSILVKAGETWTPERQSILLSENISKISNSIATSSGKCTLSSVIDPNGFPESITDSTISGEADVPHSGEDGLKTFESPNHTGNAANCQKKGNPANLASSNPGKILYVKRKSNQLVAASDVHSAGKSQIPPSDAYFKTSKNQLVRTSDSHVKQAVSLPDDALDSQAQAAMKIVSKGNFSSVFSDFAVPKPFKRSKFSLVWTLNDTQSGKTNRVHMQCQKILPQLVPWKRVTYWRRLMNSVTVLRNGSFSTMSRKLLLLRQRHTVYTRSTSGFSLRKSKVLSINGSHLKWSKSIERDSKKANEDATLAVAAFAKKKGENHSGQGIIERKSRNHPARERIFRIGSIRYKMDSSRRTLQRISDAKSPCSGPPESGKDVKKSFIPKRLVIGNDEYVRVGNGNQLVRDPKKRTRVLANEKVRWSLYNVRLRLAKKRKYCQFFTRFGKCNKDDGKCPYIHDPSKIAVCTKFLTGLCTNPNCKLTHKVIPERMPDCSYFLQGLCNNGACPYRHVHVNPNAPICEGFLRGYCSDGNECWKKHTNTCPVFESTGSCSQGSKCKLHHPKNRNRGRKRKRGREHSGKNARGRYFGSVHKGVTESEPTLFDRFAADSAVSRGEALDFISIDVSEDESSGLPVCERRVSGDSDARDLLYEVIRPVRLMQK